MGCCGRCAPQFPRVGAHEYAKTPTSFWSTRTATPKLSLPGRMLAFMYAERSAANCPPVRTARVMSLPISSSARCGPGHGSVRCRGSTRRIGPEFAYT
ncbi:hypothetical protein A6A29_16515 [Streptomyces sp. TSRI0281]|nr:hypothetical protein A6A29_16515 [Streptomyces sp. TSRI0281]